jgi:hypothetical protein
MYVHYGTALLITIITQRWFYWVHAVPSLLHTPDWPVVSFSDVIAATKRGGRYCTFAGSMRWHHRADEHVSF